MKERTTTAYQYLGHSELKFTTVWYGNEGLDTQVELDGKFLCCITYADIWKFTEELNEVINKYRI